MESTLNNLVCNGATNSSQGLWQSYQELAGLAQTGALNVIVFFTDGRPDRRHREFPDQEWQQLHATPRNCAARSWV